MMKLLKSYKTEIDPSLNQIIKINQTIGTCRFVYNLFLAKNKELYEKEKRYMNNYEFSKWLNNEFVPNNFDYAWIKEVSSKSVRNSIDNANTAFMNFFRKKSLFPKYKKKNKNDSSMYFVKTDKNTIIKCERHRIKIPTLGWIKLKEKGYLPTNKIIRHGNITKKAGKYYISVVIEISENYKFDKFTEGIGIDLGVKDLAICSDKTIYKNINKTKIVRKLEKKLKREQRNFSKKILNKKKGESTSNINKQKLRIQKIYQRLDNIRTDYINKVISKIVKAKPSYITIEDLNISGMMKNKHLSKAIAQQKLYEFRTKLANKCKLHGIELRMVDRFYASSKICSNCGCIKKDLLLKDRIYKCKECGLTIDRDYNASLNLKEAKNYRIK